MLRLLVGLIAGLLVVGAAFAQQKEQRVALIIGNGAYKEGPLKNPVNDANDMAATLKTLGFQVILRTNAGRRQMVEAVREFGNQIKRGGVGFFYYSGHGIQSGGKNYLLPVGAQIAGDADLEFEALDANMVQAQMEEAANRVNIMVLDACRDNPFARSFRSASRGLVQMDSAKGSFVAYATSPGSVASDGDGRNGTYTKHLLNSLRQPDTRLEEVFKRVRVEVAKETRNKQIPWDSSSVLGDFYFSPPVANVATQPITAIPLTAAQLEERFWEDAKAVGNKEAFEGYLSTYPRGRYVTLAKANVLRLSSTQITSIQPVNAQVVSALPKSPNSSFKDCSDCPEMIAIPGGAFLMGSKADPFSSFQPPADEQPQHSVSINRFSIGKHEVTQEQWFAIMGDLPSYFTGRTIPVERVSWDNVQVFISRLSAKTGKNYRLPTEAEWEYLAVLGEPQDGPYPSPQKLQKNAWFSENSAYKTHPVGEKLPNAFGLHDLYGNVTEWVQDCWRSSYVGAPSDGSGAKGVGNVCTKRIARGGAWDILASGLRPGYRYAYPPNVKMGNLGFRVALNE